jgi:hypothetical protein
VSQVPPGSSYGGHFTLPIHSGACHVAGHPVISVGVPFGDSPRLPSSASMTSPAEIADWLRTTSFLEGFTDAHLWKLSRHVTPHELIADETIFQEGEPRQRLAILISGAIAI